MFVLPYFYPPKGLQPRGKTLCTPLMHCSILIYFIIQAWFSCQCDERRNKWYRQPYRHTVSYVQVIMLFHFYWQMLSLFRKSLQHCGKYSFLINLKIFSATAASLLNVDLSRPHLVGLLAVVVRLEEVVVGHTLLEISHRVVQIFSLQGKYLSSDIFISLVIFKLFLLVTSKFLFKSLCYLEVKVIAVNSNHLHL